MSELFAVMLVCRNRLRGETNPVGALRDHFARYGTILNVHVARRVWVGGVGDTPGRRVCRSPPATEYRHPPIRPPTTPPLHVRPLIPGEAHGLHSHTMSCPPRSGPADRCFRLTLTVRESVFTAANFVSSGQRKDGRRRAEIGASTECPSRRGRRLSARSCSTTNATLAYEHTPAGTSSTGGGADLLTDCKPMRPSVSRARQMN
ncbi:MAG: hypothetical protein K0Q46_3642 [Rhodococcus erythropolis]|jgi:hypothetical protein|nr:hypothetical protein [Rhodococcus erythropolis]